MSLRDIQFKHAYDSDEDDVLNEFYIPALSSSTRYRRLAGFFSSTSLAVAAKGIVGLIRNEGYIKLITGAKFRKVDIEAIKRAYKDSESVLEKEMLKELDNLESEFVKDHVRALGWMVASNRLKIKVAIVVDEDGYPLDSKTVEQQGIFHQKVGILEDSKRNRISFSGSENESAAGWQGNIEEFKVFRSWSKAEEEYFKADLMKFEKFWEGRGERTRIIDVPKAVEERLIEIAPDNIEELNLDKWIEQIAKSDRIRFRNYQKEAIESWLANGERGIFEMATGTGKTLAALGSLERVLKAEKKIIVVISSPFIHLSEQWIREFDKLGIHCDKLVADSSQNRWKDKLVDNILDVENGISERLIVLTTHNTFSSGDFMDIVKDSKKRTPDQRFLLIVDEVHGIGAPIRRKGLIDEYDYRLGLSATPKRWFDLEGTDRIFNYFGDVVFEFSLKDAIDAGYLTPYLYKPQFTHLTPKEISRYESETLKVARAYHRSKDKDEKDQIFTLLCIKRQNIIRNAENKFVVFERILDRLDEVKHCLVYCSPQQIRTVQKILNKRNIIQHKFTQLEGTKPERRYSWLSERDFLIKKFSEGTYHALVSMRCLDEGVDVPPARIAIMLANSGNPREYIQRRGRVLRRFPGKKHAVIHDIIVEPLLNPDFSRELKDLETKIVAKELKRYREFAYTSRNSTECLRKLKSIETNYGL